MGVYRQRQYFSCISDARLCQENLKLISVLIEFCDTASHTLNDAQVEIFQFEHHSHHVIHVTCCKCEYVHVFALTLYVIVPCETLTSRSV